MEAPKILYLHGFGSSGASGSVELLRKKFWQRPQADRLQVIAPDLPVDPHEAMKLIRQIVAKESPLAVIGTSMGGMYAQQLRGITRICVNPAFFISKLYSLFHVGKYKWLSPRRDGAVEFHLYKETIAHYAELEAHQFDGIDENERALCYGLFGDADDIAPGNRPIFEEHYPGQSRVFAGGHRMNDTVVNEVLLPLLAEIGI